MALDEGGNAAAGLRGYEPRKEVLLETLAEIIESHEKLQIWNDATEAAINAESENANQTLVHNIRLTAALILASGRSVSSQNFELMRALNISDQTLSASELAKGFVAGTLQEITLPVRTLAEMQRPEDMRLEHAQRRADALEASVMQIGANTLTMASLAAENVKVAWNHPEKLAVALNDKMDGAYASYQSKLNEVPDSLAKGLMHESAEQSLGASFGVAAIGMFRKAATSSGRLMRDFSEQMTFTDMSSAVKSVEYKPDNQHFIIGHVINGTLRYEIKKSDGDRWGHGNEMLASMIDKFEKNGIDIKRMQGAMMTEGPSSSVGRQYLNAIAAGHTPEEAAFMTLTGQQAKALGMNHVIVPPMSPVDNSLHPLFTKEPPVKKIDDTRSSADELTSKEVIIGQLKSLGLPVDKEQMVIAHVDKNFDVSAREDTRTL